MLRETGITLREALEMDCLKTCKLIAGAQGLGNIIYRANIMADMDIINWVNEGELLLTTAYFFKITKIERQIEFIKELKKKKLAGIAIKIYPYLNQLPEEVIDTAENLDFPIIELDFTKPFTDIITPIFKKIFNKQTTLLQKIDELHNNLMNIILIGGNAEDIVSTLCETIGNPILIKNHYFDELIYNSNIYTFDYDELKRKIDSFFNNNISNQRIARVYSDDIRIDDKTYSMIIVPIVVKNSVYGHVIAVATEKIITDFDITSIETASTVIAVESLKRISIQNVENRYKAEFFEDIISLDERRKKKAIGRAKYYKFDKGAFFNIVNIYFDKKTPNIKNKYDFNEYKSKGIYLINRICDSENMKYLVTSKGKNITIMFMWKKNESLKKKTNKIVESIVKDFEEKVSFWRYTIGIGRVYKGIENVYRSLKDAEKAIEARKAFSGGNVIDFDNLGIYKIFCQDNLKDELLKFYRATLLPLCQYDDKKDTELVKTLEAYFETNGNLTKMSQQLYTHYNTILYRVNRIQKITHMKLDNENDRFNLEAALKIKKIMEI